VTSGGTLTLIGGTNSGTVIVNKSAQLALGGTSLLNAGLISLQGAGHVIDATLLIENNVTLSGAGSVFLSPTGSGPYPIVDNGTSVTLTNLANKISGGGVIGDMNMTLINRTSGVINGNGTSSALILAATSITNSGVLEGSSPQGLVISGGTVTNAKTIEAL